MKNYLLLLRPHQLVKNLIIFFPPFLGGKLVSLDVLLVGVGPLISFREVLVTTPGDAYYRGASETFIHKIEGI